jgi:hypothetical protein
VIGRKSSGAPLFVACGHSTFDILCPASHAHDMWNAVGQSFTVHLTWKKRNERGERRNRKMRKCRKDRQDEKEREEDKKSAFTR